MDVVVIGASGDCGREIVLQLVAGRVLDRDERLQLVGRGEGKSAQSLYGFCTDLSDACAETVPELDVALSPEEIVGDIIVMAAGETIRPDAGRLVLREDLAKANASIFDQYARSIAAHGHGDEVVIIVSNPVELGVEIFCRYLQPRKVIGMGAYSDSLRFRREIAADLGMRRQLVHGFVVGEHGMDMVPLWSTVKIYGVTDEERDSHLKRLRQGMRPTDFPARLAEERKQLMKLMADRRIREAFQRVDVLPPDLRVILKPYVTHFSGSKTVAATASVTVDLVRTLMDGREIMVAGQVFLEGEFCGITGPFGVPIIAGNGGVAEVVSLRMWKEEEVQLQKSAEAIRGRLAEWRQYG